MNAIGSEGLYRWFAWMVAASWQLALLVVIIAAVAWLFRGASARLRYALWLLVLLKVFLPPSVAAPWGVGAWLVAPLGERAVDAGIASQSLLTSPLSGSNREDNAAPDGPLHTPAAGNDIAPEAGDQPRLTPLRAIALAWLVGCLAIAGSALGKYWRFSLAKRRMRPVDEGPACVELERLAMELGVRRVPELYESESAGSPFLFGVFRPAIVTRTSCSAAPRTGGRSYCTSSCTGGGATPGLAGCRSRPRPCSGSIRWYGWPAPGCVTNARPLATKPSSAGEAPIPRATAKPYYECSPPRAGARPSRAAWSGFLSVALVCNIDWRLS